MSDEAALLAAILAKPEEDTPRLVYADWLAEHEQEARAEFIRTGVELEGFDYRQDPEDGTLVLNSGDGERWGYLLKRQHDLLEAARDFGWFPLLNRTPGIGKTRPFRWWPIQYGLPQGTPILSEAIEGEPRRGFLALISVAARDWLKHCNAIIDAHPIEHLHFTTWPEVDPPIRVMGVSFFLVAGESIPFRETDEIILPAMSDPDVARYGFNAEPFLRLLFSRRWPKLTFSFPDDRA